METLFTNARLVLPPGEGGGDCFGSLYVKDGVIRNIITESLDQAGTSYPLRESDMTHVDCCGDFLLPGLVDIHCHGALGHDVMEASDAAFSAILASHAGEGTTTVVLTTVASLLEERLHVLSVAQNHFPKPEESRLAGIHLEGPWFSPLRRGAHRQELLSHPTMRELEALLKYAHVIQRVTLAPELPGALEAVRELVGNGIAVSAGHSDATREEAAVGFLEGISQVTHLYNAMSSLRKGREGLAEEALVMEGILCELIADEVHLPVELLRNAYLAKGWEEIALVSDASAGAGLQEGSRFLLGGLPCEISGGAAWTVGKDHSLAGSTSYLLHGIRTMVDLVGVPLCEAVAMATLVPAKSLRLDNRIGSLAPGKRADIILVSRDWTLRNVWIGGKVLPSLKNP